MGLEFDPEFGFLFEFLGNFFMIPHVTKMPIFLQG